MDEKEVAGLVSVLILLVLVVVIIVLFTIFVRRKNKLLEEQARTRETFGKELAESQIEIREEILRNIGWELHDNIGQLMTLAKIQVQSAQDDPKILDEAAETIGTALNELRTLSKLISPEALKSLTLPQAVEMEIARFNRLNFITSTFEVEGIPKKIDSKKEIILFRILQEFFSNTIKHSKATNLTVEFHYSNNRLQIFAQDNGIGFLDRDNFSGIGIKNMKSRAQLIHAKLDIASNQNQGTSLRLEYSFY